MQAEWYGDVVFKYPGSRAVSSLDFARLFKARCDLLEIANQVSAHFYQAKNGEGPLSCERLMGLLGCYQDWFRNLAPSLQPHHIVYPVELQLQYVILLSILLIYRSAFTYPHFFHGPANNTVSNTTPL